MCLQVNEFYWYKSKHDFPEEKQMHEHSFIIFYILVRLISNVLRDVK